MFCNCIVTADFSTHGGSHLYGLPYPSADSLDPMDHFVPLMFLISSLKTCIIWYTRLLNPFSRIYADLTLKPVYIGMCAKGKIVLEFSLMWIWVTCLLAFHIPWDRSDLTFHYPNEALYKETFGYFERRWIQEQENYSPLLPNLILESASLCPLENFVFFPIFPFSCELAIERWRIELVEAQVGDSVAIETFLEGLSRL